MKNQYQKSNTWIYTCKYHIIFCPKYRRKVLVNGVDEKLKQLLLEWQEELQYHIVEMEIMPDHCHLLLETTVNCNLSDMIGTIKGRSARILRKEFPYLKTRMPNLWTRSKFVATVDSVSLDVVKKYIEEQKHV